MLSTPTLAETVYISASSAGSLLRSWPSARPVSKNSASAARAILVAFITISFVRPEVFLFWTSRDRYFTALRTAVAMNPIWRDYTLIAGPGKLKTRATRERGAGSRGAREQRSGGAEEQGSCAMSR